MTTTTQTKHTNIIPDRYKHVISQRGHEVLEANRLIVEIDPIEDCPVIHHFPFAGIFQHIPQCYDYSTEKNNPIKMTLIKADEIGATDDDTVKLVLTRLGCDLADTHYWKVYAYELATPNKKGLTKLFTTNPLDVPASAGGYHFAGFGYRDTKKVEPEQFDAWVIEQDERLMGCLYPIALYVNELLVSITIRDADDGMYIAQERGGADITPNDRRLIARGEELAKSYREGSQYSRLKAEQAAKAHILPDGFENLLSDSTKALLADRGLRVNVFELPQTNGYGGYLFDGLFTVDGHYLVEDGMPASKQRAVIRDEDFGATLAETAQNLMARMEQGEEGMSYWAIYEYETETPNKYGHTTIYTTDITDAPEGKEKLAGIAINYNFDAAPTPDVEKDWQTKQRVARKNRLAGYTPDEKEVELAEWRERHLSSLKDSVFNAEVFVNKKLLDVDFIQISNGDRLVTCSYEPYSKNASEFNKQVQAAITNPNNIEDICAARLKDYLRSINAA